MKQGKMQGQCDNCKIWGDYNKVRAWQVLIERGALPNFKGRYCSRDCANKACLEIEKVYFNKC